MRNNSMPSASLPIDAALSTMWGIGRFDHLRDFFVQGSQMGFLKFELNHRVNSQMLAEVHLKDYSIPVIHEPCPADISTQTLKERDWLSSALDEDNRRQGVRAIQRSIDLAAELGSKLIVVYTGMVVGLREMEDQPWSLYRSGEKDTPAYEELKAHLVSLHAKRSPAVIDGALRSLKDLAAYTGARGIRLGLENRYHYSIFAAL